MRIPLASLRSRRRSTGSSKGVGVGGRPMLCPCVQRGGYHGPAGLRSACVPTTGARASLEGEGGAIGAVPKRLQSGHGGCESGWGVGGYWRLEMRLGAGVGVWDCLWGRGRAGVLGGGGGRTRKRHPQEHRPQRPTERSDPTQHAKGRTGDCPGPRKGTTTRRTVTRGVYPPFQAMP